MSNSQPSITLSRFIRNENTQIRLFDMGRKVSKIKLTDFEKFEQAETAYPYPYQQTAWVGVLFWNVKNKDQHNIWFLRMPLDERGFINVASRDEFMDMLLARIGEQITLKEGAGENKLTHALKDNPYVFKPTEENMALFHAKAKQILTLPPSSFLADMVSYLSNDNFDKWQHLGLQGFADFAIRQDKTEINTLLCKKINLLPEVPFNALCNALENEQCSADFTQKIVDIIQEKINNKKIDDISLNKLASCIRAVSGVATSNIKTQVLTDILNSHVGNNPAVLVMIAAKAWDELNNEDFLKLYLEKLSENPNGATLFNALMADVMFLPGKREKILTIFRDPNRSESLSASVGEFFQHMSKT